MTDAKTIDIREQPLFNYDSVVEKIIARKITKIIRRHKFENGVYRLRKVFNDKRSKLLDEHIEIIDSKKVLWVQLTAVEAQEILGTSKPPNFGTYLNDLHRYLMKHDLAMQNVPYLYIHEFKYISKPRQMTL